MRSVADELRAERHAEVGRLSPGQRLALALELGERDLRAFQRVRRVDRDTARRELQRKRQVGRQPCGCLDALLSEGIAVAAREGDVDDPLAGVVRVDLAGEQPLDLIVGRSPWQDDVLARAVAEEFEGIRIPVATASDLVLLKLFAGGAQDRWDIQQLLAGPGRERIATEVARELARLPSRCRKLWRALSRG